MSGATVAGADGCRAGWIVAIRPLATPLPLTLRLVPHFIDLLALPEQPAVIGIDIPIGLPEQSGPGGRAADIAARAGLGGRQSAVFAVPSRAAVMAIDYRAACAAALATSEPPRAVSKQTFFLFPKIREVDAALSADTQNRVFEVHPEVAFWAMNGGRALDEPKKVKSRPYPPGLALRRELLSAAGYDLGLLSTFRLRTSEGGEDDILDAIACSWTAARIATGSARRFPADPPVDAKGLRMEIWG